MLSNKKVNSNKNKYNLSEKDFIEFKNNLLSLKSFSHPEDALMYYQDRLGRLLYMSGRSLDQLMSEHSVAQMPSLQAMLAHQLIEYIEQFQGI